MIDKKMMMDDVYKQLAIDYNCSPEDFLEEGIIFTEARISKGRRPWPWITPRLELVTFGTGVVVNASEDVLPYVCKQLEGKTRFEVFCTPFVCGVNLYYLPDICEIVPVIKPDGFEYELVEKRDIHKLYETNGFRYAIQYDINSLRPDKLVSVARFEGTIVGMAGASDDCDAMQQIGVDVLPKFRGKGLASALVSMLTLEILNRGYIPYYFTDCSNVYSQRVAIKAGYFPAWSHCYRTRLECIAKHINN